MKQENFTRNFDKELTIIESNVYHLNIMQNFFKLASQNKPEITTKEICNELNISENEWLNYVRGGKPVSLTFYIILFRVINFDFSVTIRNATDDNVSEVEKDFNNVE